MQMDEITIIPRVLKHSFYSINYSYPTRFSKNPFKQPYAATNHEKFSIEARDSQLWNKFLSEKEKTMASTIFFQKHNKSNTAVEQGSYF